MSKVTARMAKSILRYKGPTNVTEDSLAAEVLNLRRRLARALRTQRARESDYDAAYDGWPYSWRRTLCEERAELRARHKPKGKGKK